MKNYKWILDAGHGGMKDGVYTTAPNKMFVFEDGLTFYEGVNNRLIADKLVPLLETAGIDYAKVYDPELDTPLKTRVLRANKLCAKRQCIYLSIHSDAMPAGAHGKGSGFSVYTSKGKTAADAIGTIFIDTYAHAFAPIAIEASAGKAELTQFKLRTDFSDGDGDQEENFYVLRKTKCPAILVENLFFDNRSEAEFLLSEEGQHRIARTLFRGILATEGESV